MVLQEDPLEKPFFDHGSNKSFFGFSLDIGKIRQQQIFILTLQI
jgi:hypothetical protein